MAKIAKIKARKEYKCSKCGEVINIGDLYVKATPYRQNPIIRCTKCGIKAYEISGSSYVQELGAIVEDWRDNFNIYDGTADEIATVLEEIRDQQQESLDNMPENFQYGDTGTMLQERIDCLESVIDELNNISWGDCEDEARSEAEQELGEYDPESDDNDYPTEEEYDEALEERVQELTEEKYEEAIEEAISNLEY